MQLLLKLLVIRIYLLSLPLDGLTFSTGIARGTVERSPQSTGTTISNSLDPSF